MDANNPEQRIKVIKGSVVQLNEESDHPGAFGQVESVHNWGARVYIYHQGDFPLYRVKWSEIEYIGQAVIIVEP